MNIQRRALQIIVGNVSYEVACDELVYFSRSTR